MKKIVLAIGCFLTSFGLLAQDCSLYMYMRKNKTIEMTGFGPNQAVVFKSVTTVTDVSSLNGLTTANVLTNGYSYTGKLVSSTKGVYKCDGGILMMDVSANFPQQSNQSSNSEVKVSDSLEEYPANMHVGDHLKDALKQLETTDNGVTVIKKSNITDRVVVAKETVTTTAGSWSCLKITCNSLDLF